ncbi:hypothetical protein [Microbacterium sp. P04]|uniref:hypothetical protein n=1 Tax=Microbacterium sp. P04 TaxID=3366947 RepID=UPI0037472AD0
MRTAQGMTAWGAAAVAVVLIATASPAAALTTDETPASVDVSAPSPEPSASPVQTAPAEQEPAPAQSTAPEATPAEEAEAPLTEERAQRERVAIAAAAVGDLVVTSFDDRYADGVYDPSKTARDGMTDQRNSRLYEARTSTGERAFATVDANGDYRFEDLPVGETTIFFLHPNSADDSLFFDATGATTAADIEKLPNGSAQGTPAGLATVTVDEDGEKLVVGLTALRSAASVTYPDGSPVTGLDIEFGSVGGWYDGVAYADSGDYSGTYEALRSGGGYYRHLPGQLGMRLSPPAGFEVATVTAADGVDIPVTARDGGYWIDDAAASSYFSNPTFTVKLKALPTGDLTVTRFDDRYADGLFDTSKTARDGRTDEKRTDLQVRLLASDGSWHNGAVTTAGDFAFDDVPQGPAKVYLQTPNDPAMEVFFDATGATTAEDIERLPASRAGGWAGGEAAVTIDADGEDLLIGMTALRSSVKFEDEDGAIVPGVTAVELGSGGQWFPATEWTPGTHEAFDASGSVRHLPAEIGVRFAVPEGYAVDEVVSDDPALEVTASDGGYWIDTTDSFSYISYDNFVVTLEEVPTSTVAVTYFADVALDGVYESATDETIPGAEIYLQDAAGEWWATTSLDGDYTFSGVAPGAATIYAEIPETTDAPEMPELPELELPEASLAIWDATDLVSYTDTVRAETDTISFEGGTFIDPATGATSPLSVDDQLVGVIPATLAEGDQARRIGAASIFQLAAFVGPVAEEPVMGAEIEFLANTESADGVELLEGSGAFAAQEDDELAVFGAAEYGIRPTAPEGYEIVAVTAVSALTGTVLEVTESSAETRARLALFAAGTEYRVAPQQVGGPFGAVVWAVQVAPTAPVGTTPPAADPGFGLPLADGQPAAGPTVRQLPATGSEAAPWAWMLTAGLLLAAGLATRVTARRRHS